MTFGCFDELAGFLKAQLVLGHVSSGLQICRAGGYFFLVFRGFRRQRLASFLLLVSCVFGRFGLGFRWCLVFSHPLPTRSIFVFVCATVVVQLLRSFTCL